MTDEAEGKGAAPPLKAHFDSDQFVDDEEVAADVADGQSKSSAEAVDKGVSASHKVREYPLRETRISLPAFLNVCGESGHGFSEYFQPRATSNISSFNCYPGTLMICIQLLLTTHACLFLFHGTKPGLLQTHKHAPTCIHIFSQSSRDAIQLVLFDLWSCIPLGSGRLLYGQPRCR